MIRIFVLLMILSVSWWGLLNEGVEGLYVVIPHFLYRVPLMSFDKLLFEI